MLANRLSHLADRLSVAVENSLESIDRTGVGESIYHTMKFKTNTLVLFAVQCAVKASLKPAESDAVLPKIFFIASEEELQYYWERFREIPKEMSMWRRCGCEYQMAGLAFQEACGTTENKAGDDLIRGFGAHTFANVFKLTRQELTSVRLEI
jgi:hypothetical protein